MATDLQQEQTYNSPIEIFGDDYASLQSFFQYLFPPKRLSPQALGLQEKLTDTQKDGLYTQMLTSVGMRDQDILFSSTLGLYYSKDLQTVQSMGLSDATFTYDRRKGFSQIINATSRRTGEHKLTALSRRLRDSFGHGRIGAYGNYVLFEDLKDNPQKKTKTITGRIILMKGDLKIWKRTIEQYIS